MSIQEMFSKINLSHTKNPRGGSVPDIETVSFNDEGIVENPSILKRLYWPLFVILVIVLSFGLGRLSKVSKGPEIRLEYNQNLNGEYSLPKVEAENSSSSVEPQTTSSKPTVNSETVVGSVKGSKYHYLYCPGAKQISEANKITFKNAASAQAAGYILALNCKPR